MAVTHGLAETKARSLGGWNQASIHCINTGTRDATSLRLGFSASEKREVGKSPSPGGGQEFTLEWKASPDSSARQGLPAAKCYYESQVHTHYVPLQCVSLLPSPIFRPAWGSPASFPAQWHDLRLTVHHRLDGQGAGTAKPHSAACLFFLAMPLLSSCFTMTVNATSL